MEDFLQYNQNFIYEIHRLAVVLGLDEGKLRAMMEVRITDANIKMYGSVPVAGLTLDAASGAILSISAVWESAMCRPASRSGSRPLTAAR